MTRLIRRAVLATVRDGATGGQFASSVPASWTVPAGVTSICAVAIGAGGAGGFVHDGEGGGYDAPGPGGGLAYRNDIPVTPGETLTITVNGFGYYLSRAATTLVAATNGDNAASPGFGLGAGAVTRSGGAVLDGFSGGGAAGYTSNGGTTTANTGKGGKGTGSLGGGAGAAAGAAATRNGEDYGGGGGLDPVGPVGGAGGIGIVRIIWATSGVRAFPNTNTLDL